MRYTDNWLAKTAKCWDNEYLHYVDMDVKKNAHQRASRLLQSFAVDYLGIERSKYEVRSNRAGVACSGEVTLHTEAFVGTYGIYIQIGQFSVGTGTILYRCCDNMADYKGYRNNWSSVTQAFGTKEAIKKFADTIRQLCNTPNQSRI